MVLTSMSIYVNFLFGKLWDLLSHFGGIWRFSLIVAKWCDIATYVLVNIGLDNGLLPDGIKPLPEPMLPSHWWDSAALAREQF